MFAQMFPNSPHWYRMAYNTWIRWGNTGSVLPGNTQLFMAARLFIDDTAFDGTPWESWLNPLPAEASPERIGNQKKTST